MINLFSGNMRVASAMGCCVNKTDLSKTSYISHGNAPRVLVRTAGLEVTVVIRRNWIDGSKVRTPDL
jgi:hypothetical protein